MSEYVPTTDVVALRYRFYAEDNGVELHPAEFDTWLNSIKADAFSEGAAKQREIVEHKLGNGQTIVIPNNPYRNGGR